MTVSRSETVSAARAAELCPVQQLAAPQIPSVHGLCRPTRARTSHNWELLIMANCRSSAPVGRMTVTAASPPIKPKDGRPPVECRLQVAHPDQRPRWRLQWARLRFALKRQSAVPARHRFHTPSRRCPGSSSTGCRATRSGFWRCAAGAPASRPAVRRQPGPGLSPGPGSGPAPRRIRPPCLRPAPRRATSVGGRPLHRATTTAVRR